MDDFRRVLGAIHCLIMLACVGSRFKQRRNQSRAHRPSQKSMRFRLTSAVGRDEAALDRHGCPGFATFVVKFCVFWELEFSMRRLGILVATLVTVFLGISWTDTQPQVTPMTQPTPQQTPAITSGSQAGEEPRNPDFLVRIQQQPAHDEKTWYRVIWDSFFPWPLLVFLIVIYLLYSSAAPSRIESLLQPFHSVKLFGQKFVLNQRGGRNAETGIHFYRQEIQTKFDRKVKKLKIARKHKAIIDQYATKVLSDLLIKHLRSTIHVPDMLFDEALYQLIEYYPESPQSPHGRSFSVRYGIIGKAWRLEESQHAGAVPTTREELILGWGMTKNEAERAGKGRQSFACIVLKKDQRSLGIFYLDAQAKDAFGDTDTWCQLQEAIQKGAAETKLLDALEAIHQDLLNSSPRVQIFSEAGKSS